MHQHPNTSYFQLGTLSSSGIKQKFLFILIKHFIIFKILFTYFWLHWVFSICSGWRLVLGCGARTLDNQASVTLVHGLNCSQGMWDLPRIRDRTRVPCLGRQILNQGTIREVPVGEF